MQREKPDRKSYKEESDDEEDLPLAARMGKSVKKDVKKAVKRKQEESEFSPTPKKKKSESKSKASVKRESTGGDASLSTPKKGRKKTEDETQERWKW